MKKIYLAITPVFLFLCLTGCELVKGNDDRMHGWWEERVGDGKIFCNTDKKWIKTYRMIGDSETEVFFEGPYHFKKGKLVIDNIPWLEDGDYDVYFSGKNMYWYTTVDSYYQDYRAVHEFKRADINDILTR